jgi:hypothetical protein
MRYTWAMNFSQVILYTCILSFHMGVVAVLLLAEVLGRLRSKSDTKSVLRKDLGLSPGTW